MNFHQLQYAVAIARHGLSVTQAASALGTSQPAISRALKALERELGFDLFVREGRAFSRVTPQGTKVLEYATSRAGRDRQPQGGRRGPEPGQSRHACRSRPRTPRRATCCRRWCRRFASATRRSSCTCTRAPRSRSARWWRPTGCSSRSRPARTGCFRDWCCCRCIAGTARSSCPSTTRWRSVEQLTLQGSGAVSAGHLRVQLHRLLVAAYGIRARGPDAESGPDGARFGRHQDLRATRAGRRHRRQRRDRSGAGHATSR